MAGYATTVHEAIEKQKADGKAPEIQELTDEEAMDEIVADFTAEFIENTDKFSEFVSQSEEHRSWGKKLLDFLKKVIADIKARFKTQSARDLAAANEFGFKLTDLEEAAKKWEAAWKASEKAVKKAPVRESTGEGETKYSMVTATAYDYSKPFSQQIQDWIDGKIPSNDSLVISGTPDVWKLIGMNSLPVTINQSHIDYAINGTKDADHLLTKEGLLKLPEAIKHPVAIISSKSKNGTSLVAMLDIRQNGKQVIVPVVIDGFSRQNNILIDSNALTSAYGKNYSISKVLHDALEAEANGKAFSVYYVDIKKATALLQKARVLMPKSFAVGANGFVHSIDEPGSPVKKKFSGQTETQQFKRWFGKSKVVGNDGKPLIMYHGTPEQFTVFDRSKGKRTLLNSLGAGNYFTSDISVAQKHATGDNGVVMEVYLSVQNPIEVRSRSELRSRLFDKFGNWKDKTAALMEAEGISYAEAEGRIVSDLVQQMGYDGVVMTDKESGEITVVTYKSVQAKSATDNIGTFDGSNPDIRYSVSGTEELLHKATDKELDSRYAEAVKNYDSATARAAVAEKARRWGAILDKNGKPKHFYHGTSQGGFTEFDAYGHGKFGLFGIGNYFTEDYDVAASYMSKGNGTQPEIYSVYLKSDNPIDMDANADISKWQAAAEEVDFSDCKTNEDCFVAVKEYCKDEMMVRWEAEEYITGLIQGMGYDGITHIGGGRYNRNSGPRHRVVITFEPEQAKSALETSYDNDGKLIPLSERFSDKPDYRYSLAGTESLLHEEQKKAINDARNAHGTIKPGEKPAREAFVPKAMEKGKNVSLTIRTALEAGATPDAIVPKIADGIINGQFSDEVHTNKDTLKAAKAWIEAYPIAERALDDWNEKIKSGRNLNETDTVKGYLLYNLLATSASEAKTPEKMEWYSEEAIKVLTSVANLTRSSARMVQSTRLLKKLTPAGQYFSLERAVERLNRQIANGTAEIQLEKGRTKLEIDQEIAAKWMQALHDGKTKEAAYYEEQLYQSIAKQVKRTFMDRWNAWRYLSMLGNVKTITRNLIGNLFMIPVKATKDKIGAIIELLVPKESRTKYLGGSSPFRCTKAE